MFPPVIIDNDVYFVRMLADTKTNINENVLLSDSVWFVETN